MRCTHHVEFGPRSLVVPVSPFVQGARRPQPLVVFEWLPFSGASLANAAAALEVVSDTGGIVQNRLDVSLVIATDVQAPFGPDLFVGTLTNFTQSAIGIASLPGRVPYIGPGVYTLGVVRRDLCASRARLEIWASTAQPRTLVLGGHLSLTVGSERDWRSMAYVGARGGAPFARA